MNFDIIVDDTKGVKTRRGYKWKLKGGAEASFDGKLAWYKGFLLWPFKHEHDDGELACFDTHLLTFNVFRKPLLELSFSRLFGSSFFEI